MRTAALIVMLAMAASCTKQAARDSTASLSAVKPLKPGQRWTNSLDQVFVQVPGAAALACIWETRVQDFDAFVKAKGYDTGNETLVLLSDGWKTRPGFNWRNPGFKQGPSHPVVAVSWEDAHEFCDWLTDRERERGTIGAEQGYRLPTELEWSRCAGNARYPWGDRWPPPKGAGNYGGDEARDSDWPTNYETISGYRDDYARTAPVGSFEPNALGCYDVGGNVWEWCDNNDDDPKPRVMRGGSWYFGKAEYHPAAFRIDAPEHFSSSCTGFRIVLDLGEVPRK